MTADRPATEPTDLDYAKARLEDWLPERIRNDPDAMANFRWRVRDAIRLAIEAEAAQGATPRFDLREQLAALEHEQWEHWSRTVAEQGLTPERIERWERYWVPLAGWLRSENSVS